MVDLHYWVRRRDHARTFGEWFDAQAEVDRAFRAMGHTQDEYYAHLADTELVFPQIRRDFNGREQT